MKRSVHVEQTKFKPATHLLTPSPFFSSTNRHPQEKNIILKYACQPSVWSPLYMENTVRSVKVVEPNNFLMYTMHECQSARSSRAVCLSSCIYINVHTFSALVHLKGRLHSFCVSRMKKYTSVCGHQLCISFLNGLQWMCATHILTT